MVLRPHDIYKIFGLFWGYSHWIPPCNNLVCVGWGTAYARGGFLFSLKVEFDR